MVAETASAGFIGMTLVAVCRNVAMSGSGEFSVFIFVRQEPLACP